MIAETNSAIGQISMQDLRALMEKSSYGVDHFPDLLERSGAPASSFSISDDYVDSGMVWTVLSSVGHQVGDEFLGLSTHPVAPGSTQLMVARAMSALLAGQVTIRGTVAKVMMFWMAVQERTPFTVALVTMS